MGWKSVKEYYKIKHIVCISDGKLCIGSNLCHDLFSFDMAGRFIKAAIGGWGKKDDSFPWMEELKADSEAGRLADLIAEADSFGKTIPVWTHDYSKVVEKRAEKFGHPNVCTDGDLQYANQHFRTKKEAEKQLFTDSLHFISFHIERCGEEIDRLREKQVWLVRAFTGLVNASGMSKKFAFNLEQMNHMLRVIGADCLGSRK